MIYKEAFKNIQYIHVKKGEYLFNEGDEDKRFFVIIQGEISIRKKDKYIKQEDNPNENNFMSEVEARSIYFDKIVMKKTNYFKKFIKKKLPESEIMRFTQGMCFGEWALLKCIKRTASACAITNCDLFYINEADFEPLKKCIEKTESDKVSFLCKNVLTFGSMNYQKFSEYYRNIIPLNFFKGNTVYLEGSKADSLYILYKGECELKKNIKNVSNIDEFSVKTMTTVLKLSSGEVSGLETLYKKGHYEQSMIVSADYTFIFRIPLDSFKMIYKELYINYQSLYRDRSIYVNNFIERNMQLKDKMKINYRAFTQNKLYSINDRKVEELGNQQLKYLLKKKDEKKGKINEIHISVIKHNTIDNSVFEERKQNKLSSQNILTLKSNTREMIKSSHSVSRKITLLRNFTRSAVAKKSVVSAKQRNNIRATTPFIQKIKNSNSNLIYTIDTGMFNLPLVSIYNIN